MRKGPPHRAAQSRAAGKEGGSHLSCRAAPIHARTLPLPLPLPPAPSLPLRFMAAYRPTIHREPFASPIHGQPLLHPFIAGLC
jgi:hypothetical protein